MLSERWIVVGFLTAAEAYGRIVISRPANRFTFDESFRIRRFARRRCRAAVRAASRSGTLKIETQTRCRRVRPVVLAVPAPTTREVTGLYCSADDGCGIGLQILFFPVPLPPIFRRLDSVAVLSDTLAAPIEIMPTHSDRQYYYYYYTHEARYIYIILFLLKIKTGPRMRVS